MIKPTDGKYLSELKQLNDDLIEYLNECHKTSSFFDYGPTFLDYIDQLKKLDEQYSDKNGSNDLSVSNVDSSRTGDQSTVLFCPPKTNQNNALGASAILTSPTPSLTTSTSSLFSSSLTNTTIAITSQAASSTSTATATTTTTTSIAPQITFGSAAPFSFTSPFTPLTTVGSSFSLPNTSTSSTTTTAAPASTTATFSFGIPSASTTFGSTSAFGTTNLFGSASPFARPAPPPASTDLSKTTTEPNDDPGETVDGPNEAEVPDQPLDKYEEPDALLSVRCKLYAKEKTVKGEVDLQMKGLGNLYVKNVEPNKKLQVIFRQEPDLKRVLLNEVVTSDIPVKIVNKAVQMLFPDPSSGTKLYIAKTKDDSDALKLFDILRPDLKKR